MRQLPIPTGVTPASLDWSPDGRLLLAVGGWGGGVVWSWERDEAAYRLAAARPLKVCVFSRDGTLPAAAGDEGTLALWDARTGRKAGEMAADAADLQCLTFSPDGTLLACGALEGSGRIWGVRTRQPVRLVGSPGPAINGIAWSPDGAVLLGACD